MPLVLAANQSSQREQNYSDVLEVEYEYPKTYRNRVVEGETFIYYRGTKGTDAPGYFGAGVIGPIRESKTAGRLVCDVLDVTFFDETIPLKDPATADYHEVVGPNRVNLRQGVRPITDEIASRILRLADTALPSQSPTATTDSNAPIIYQAKKATQDAVFRYSTDVALALLADRYPAASITEMPKNNPGFDILVEGAGRRFVEVKGTMNPEVAFFLSEGERAYSEAHADDYMLIVVHNINLIDRTHEIAIFVGAIQPSVFDLEPIQYRVRTPAS